MPLHITLLHGRPIFLLLGSSPIFPARVIFDGKHHQRLVLGLLVSHETKASVDPWSVSWQLRLPAELHPCRLSQLSLEAARNPQRVVSSSLQPGRANRSAVWTVPESRSVRVRSCLAVL